MSKQEAYLKTIKLAKEKLAGINLDSRYANLGLPNPQNGKLNFRAFGIDMSIDENFDIIEAKSGKPAKLGDHIIILHYLLYDGPLEPTGQLITFRDLPGGQFYWNPFLSRSINPLISQIGNDIELLRKRLNKFDWKPATGGDLAVTIHAVGKIDATLVYHLGDDEFQPAANIMFDSCIKKVFNTEDVAWLAGRICLALLY
ncbi:MAG: hypothetical protein A2Y10_18705 [Planctomycetes bacterium GWF2_41_51]|nr:MAG: hypothetical protein A2Y10_18705 [Planctomycetes bacterium GWF2_41_51]HBG27121.1 hypothetical protein [Phycisphaerales bacterium]